jgi:cholesterol oxidase
LPGLSPTLGSRFCGNGDFLSFAFRCGDTDDAGVRTPRLIDPSHGPVITSTFRLPDHRDGVPGGRGFYLQDAGYPAFLNWVVEAADAGGQAKRIGGFLLRRARALVHGDPQSDISGEMDRLLGDCELSGGSMPLLGMGRDVPDGKMTLREGREPGQQFLDVDWENVASRPFFKRMTEVSREVAESVGADFEANPAFNLFNRLITVHPLGGCPMGRNPNEGVVSSQGEVWGHPNLFVADGSVLPGPVGANPCLTIAAVADRFADGILEAKPG